jgi:hypothetical protein
MGRRLRLPAALVLLAIWPASAEAHGLPPGFAVFVLSFIGLYVVLSIAADVFAIKRWLVPARPVAAAVLANIAAVLAIIAAYSIWEPAADRLAAWLDTVDGSYRGYSYGGVLRMYGWWVELPFIWFAGLLARCGVLKWRFGVPMAWRSLLVLGLSNGVALLLAGLASFLMAVRFRG